MLHARLLRQEVKQARGETEFDTPLPPDPQHYLEQKLAWDRVVGNYYFLYIERTDEFRQFVKDRLANRDADGDDPIAEAELAPANPGRGILK